MWWLAQCMCATCNRDPHLLGLYDSHSCAHDMGVAVLAVMLGRRHRCTITPQVCALAPYYKNNAVLKEGGAVIVSNCVTDTNVRLFLKFTCTSTQQIPLGIIPDSGSSSAVLYQIVVAVQRMPLVTVTNGVANFANCTSACACNAEGWN